MPPLKVHMLLDENNDTLADDEFARFNRTIYDATNLPSTLFFRVISGDVYLKRAPESPLDRISSLWNSTHFIEGNGYFVPPSAHTRTERCAVERQGGSYLFFANFFYDNFPHFLVDHVPSLMVLVRVAQQGWLGPAFDGAKVLVPSDDLAMRTIAYMTRGNASAAALFEYYDMHAVNCFRDAVIGTLHYQWAGLKHGLDISFNTHSPYSLSVARDVIDSFRPPPPPCAERFVVLYSRAGSNVHHNRRVGNEDAAVRIVRQAMADAHVNATFRLFEGEESYEEQVELFRCADVVVGPHGAGMGNTFWISASHACADPVHVIEVVCSSRSASISGACPFRKTFFALLSGLPWVRYHALFFASGSNSSVTYLPLDALSVLLREVFTVKYGRKMESFLRHNSHRFESNGQVFHSEHAIGYGRA